MHLFGTLDFLALVDIHEAQFYSIIFVKKAKSSHLFFKHYIMPIIFPN